MNNELALYATTEEISVVQQEGTRSVSRNRKIYNLDAIIAAGYRVNSLKETQSIESDFDREVKKPPAKAARPMSSAPWESWEVAV